VDRKVKKAFQVVGVVGTLLSLAIFIKDPSFPTPDKLIVFLVFVFMSISQAKVMLKRLLPFVAILLVYESFRGIADSLNTHVNYTFAPHMDRLLFGNLPTVYLQNWLWHGHVMWYDIVLYIPYLLFFIVPIGLAILVWKTCDKYYWEVVTTYLAVFFGSFLTFLLFPAAPPWMAAQTHVIQPIVRVSSNVWASMGLHNFPSFYNHISPNPVAAVPSLHSACGVLFSLFVFKIYGRRWGYVSLLYPVLLIFGVIYEGEHYAFDVILGASYAVAAFIFIPKTMPTLRRLAEKISRKIEPVLAWRPSR
jgi:membrane-associated phospholipid phosphatase